MKTRELNWRQGVSSSSATRGPPLGGRCVFAGMVTAAFFALYGTPASAQAMRGKLTEAVDGRPIPYASVTLQDSLGTPVGRGFADQHGLFEIRAPGEGHYSVRVERMGIWTYVSAPFLVTADSTPDREFLISMQAIEVSGIDATVSRRCNGDPDLVYSGRVFWEKVRQAHSQPPVLAPEEQIQYDVVEYRRSFDGRGSFVQADSQALIFHEEVYKSLPADSLLNAGFVQPAPGGMGWAFFGPDLNVLLSDAFLKTYCFRTGPETRDSDLIRLIFEPAGPEHAPGIAGTVWIHPESLEIRRVEFAFTRYPYRVSGIAGGGEIEFMRLSEGRYVATRWRIRVPNLVERTNNLGLGLEGYYEIERRVTAAYRADGTTIPLRRPSGQDHRDDSAIQSLGENTPPLRSAR